MSYLGSKNGAGVFQAICALMPPHDTYIEPFAGSAAILKAKAAAARSYAIEKDRKAFADLWAWACAQNQHGLLVLQADALTWLETLEIEPRHGRLLIYADPPYPLSTRTSAKRYRHDFTDRDHERLAAILQDLSARGAKVIVSTYPCELYDRLYGERWRQRQFQAMTRGGVRTEQLWFNFAPSAVHWAEYAGDGWIDRQRIKRKAARWARMFHAMPHGERQAVLAAIMGFRDPD